MLYSARMKLLTHLYQQTVLRPYFTLRTWWPFWFNVLNAPNRKFLAEHPPVLDAATTRITKELAQRGIAASSLSELFPDQPNLLSELQAYAHKLGEGSTVNRKVFLLHLWNPKGFTLTKDNPFSRFVIDPRITGMAGTYLGLAPKLQYFTLGRSVPVSDVPMESQRWHRDPEEKKMFKMFIYLTDVTEGTGAFEYIPETVYGMKDGNRFPQRPPLGIYPPTKDVEALFPPERRQINTGPAGTVLFCDTTGLHRGGYCTTGERVMYTLFYSAPTLCLPAFGQQLLPEVVSQITDPLTRNAVRPLVRE